MTDADKKIVRIPEITRVEGHAAVTIDIKDGQVADVTLNVFEGTRFFERIVLGHAFFEIPHITSRVCAICSTGHLIAASFAVERIFNYTPSERVLLLRELMHLGMMIESHATHIFALALPDFVGAGDLMQLASEHSDKFQAWNRLRSVGASIQTLLGGRPFHAVNLQIGGFSSHPTANQLRDLQEKLNTVEQDAQDICEFLIAMKPKVARTSTPSFLALIPEDGHYGYFGTRVRSSDGWERPVDEYKEFLDERAVSFSHAKRTTALGRSMMVGSMARLHLYSGKLKPKAAALFSSSALASGDTNSIWNNLAQAIEIVEAIERSQELINILVEQQQPMQPSEKPIKRPLNAGGAVGAVECPRGTLYHYYELDSQGRILAADMITPSVQNSARIEQDIREVIASHSDVSAPDVQANLETLVRAYDPCNTCATHMVTVRYGHNHPED